MSNNNEEDRKFLHDIATPMSVVDLMVRRLLKDLKEETPKLTKEKSIEILSHCVEYLDKMKDLHAGQKARISGQDKAS